MAPKAGEPTPDVIVNSPSSLVPVIVAALSKSAVDGSGVGFHHHREGELWAIRSSVWTVAIIGDGHRKESPEDTERLMR